MKLLILLLFLKEGGVPLSELPEPDSFDFAVALVSGVENNFEPCGCGNPPFRGGELSKKAFVIKFLKQKYGKKLLAFDTGNYVSPSGDRELLKIFKDILKIMKIDGMAISSKDVVIERSYFEYLVRVLKYPFFGFYEKFEGLIPPYKKFKINGLDIYFTSFVPHTSLENLPEYEKKIFKKLKENSDKNSFTVIVTPENTLLPFDTLQKIFHIAGLSGSFDVVFNKEKSRYFLRVSRYGLYLPIVFFKKRGAEVEVFRFIKIPLDNTIQKDGEVERFKEKWEEVRRRKMEEIRKKFIKKIK